MLFLNWKIFLAWIATVIFFMIVFEILLGGKIDGKLIKRAISDQIVGRLIGEIVGLYTVYIIDPTLFYPILFGTILVVISHKDRLLEQIKKKNA
jgi:nitrogen fixation/metabolism regulation signal transduction histidine kinase